MTAVIDAYDGSRDQLLGRANRTKEVKEAVLRTFPDCTIIEYERNVGLAKANFDLQTTVFQQPNSDWAIFIEEDITLHPQYLEVMSALIDACTAHDDVVKVSTDHINLNYLWHKPQQDQQVLYFGQGTKAVAERRSYFELRKPLSEIYLDKIKDRAYSNRDEADVFITMAQHGVFTLMGNNDVVHDRMIIKFSKLHIAGNMHLAVDDGLIGETDYVYPEFPHIPISPLSKTDISGLNVDEALRAIRSDVYRFERRFFRDIWNAYLVSTSGSRSIQVLLGKLSKTLRKLLPRRFR